MANTVSSTWRAKEVLGTPNPAYPYIDFTWDTSHAELSSPLFDFPIRGNVITFLINTEQVDTGTSATMTFKLKGAAKPDAEEFENIYTPSAIANSALDRKTPVLKYDFDVTTTPSYPYMKITMDPNANIASTKPIRVGVISDAKT